MKLKIHIPDKEGGAVFIVSYKNGEFYRLEHVRGRLTKLQYNSLMKIVPPSEAMISPITSYYKMRVNYELIQDTDSATLYSQMMEIYAHWYQRSTGLNVKIDGITGKSLKQIITHLQKLSAGDEEVLEVFKLIFERWDEQVDFYRNQRELRQINSNINVILNFLKNGTSDSKSKATVVSDDFRKTL